MLYASDRGTLDSAQDARRGTDGGQRDADRHGARQRLVPAPAVLPQRGLHHQVQPEHGSHLHTGDPLNCDYGGKYSPCF